jgi:hypothetical protein
MSAETPKPTDSVVATINKTMQEGKVTQLAPNRLQLAEHAHQTYVAYPEADTPPEAVLDPKYWAHYSVNHNTDMKPNDIILVKPEDGTYFMELMVRAKFTGGVKVAELRRVMLDKAETTEDLGDYETRWSGNRLKWRVIRKSDKRELVSGLETKDAAYDWLREHKKAFAA